jgi:cathepsin B
VEESAKVRLGIESDLSKLGAYRAWNAQEDCEENAQKSFEQAMKEASLDKELTDEERALFKKRFIKEMKHDCDEDPNIDQHWTEDVALALENEKPVVTDALVNHINEAGEGWEAKEDPEHLTMAMLKQKCGKKDDPEAPSEHLDLESGELNLESGDPPGSYNTADAVPACKKQILRMHNQGTCGSCWAFGTMSAIDSRLCIKSNGAFSGERAVFSRGHMTSCGYQGRDGCQGGNFPAVYKLFASGGVPLGSSGTSVKGCIPYFGSGSGVDHFDSQSKAPPCASRCVTQSPAYPRSMSEDKLKISGYSGREYGPFKGDTYQKAEAFSRKEIYKNGPLPIAVQVDSRFQSYKSGIYKNGCNSKSANHVTVAYGYTPQSFLTMNSWGGSWGNKGHMEMANCEIAEWSVMTESKLGNYKLPGGNAPPAPGPGPAPAPGDENWSFDGDGNWVSKR